MLIHYIIKLCKETGAEYIVDSTKDPIRFRLLRSLRPNSVKLIIIVREIYGVATSGINYGKELDFEKSAKSWLRFYNKIVFNSLKGIDSNSFLIIKYEDIARNPEKIRNELTEFLNLKKTIFKNNFITKYYHLIAGNPMRYKDDFSINYDERWKKVLDENQINYLKKYQEKLSPFFK